MFGIEKDFQQLMEQVYGPLGEKQQMTEIEEIKAQLKVLEKKVALLEEIEKQPRMNLQQEGDYVIVSYNKKLYYRFLTDNGNFSWYRTQDVPKGYVTGIFEPVTDAETERLLEGLYYNHIEVKKEKEMIRQNLKTSLKELANGDVRPIDDVIEEAKEQQTKSQTLYELIADWWDEIFVNGNPSGQNIESLVEQIEREWLPKEHDTNSYKWNQCIRTIKSKLR